MVEIIMEEMSYQRRKGSIRHAKLCYRTKTKEGTISSMWIISQEDPAVEINHFEGNGPEWLVLKRTLLMAILEAQVGRRSLAKRTEKSWQIDRKPIKPKRHK